MTEPHLSEMALEVLAHGRPDLVAPSERAHVQRCAECTAAVEEARLLSVAATDALRAATPAADGLDDLIAGALAKAAPAPEPLVVRPSGRSLLSAAVVGLVATLALGVLALPSMASVVTVLKDAYALIGAIDRVVDVAVPGGWTAVTVVGFVLLALLVLPLRALVGGAPRLSAAGGATAMLFPFVTLLAVLASAPTAAALEFEGEWPEDERGVTVSIEHEPASAALRAAAESVGLGLVATLPSDPEVTLHVRDASLREVVEAVLGDAPVVARRTRSLLVIRPSEGSAAAGQASPATSPEPAAEAREVAPAEPAPTKAAAAETHDDGDDDGDAEVPATPAVPATPERRPSDRVTFGRDVTVRAGERVGDVVTMGGDVVVEGEVLGDVVTMGGDITIRGGGVVHGELVTMGGDVRTDEGAQVHGGTTAGPFSTSSAEDDGDHHSGHHGASFGGWFQDTVGSAAKHALLFLLGVLLLAFAPARLGALRGVIVDSPVRAGVSGLLGFVGATVLTIILVITLIGIPGAIIVALGAFAAVYVGLVAVATVIGAVLPVPALKDRPLLQLGTGVLVLFLASLVPVAGALVVVLASALGFGAVLLTRFRPRAPGKPAA